MAKVVLEIAADTSDLPKATSDLSAFGKAATQAGDAQKKAFKGGADAANAAQKDISNFANSINVAGINVGEVGNKFSLLKKGIGVATNAFGILRVAIAATGIGALIIAFTSLIAFFKRTEKGAELLERVLSGVGAAIDVIVGVAVKVGETLVNAFKNPLAALKSFGDALLHPIDTFNKIGDAVEATSRKMLLNAAAAAEITRAFQDLEDTERENSLLLSENQTQIDKLLVQSKNRSLSEQERIALLEQASKLEQENLKTELQNANTRISLIQKDNALKKANGIFRDEDAQKEVDAILKRDQLERQSLVLQEKIINRKEALNQEFIDTQQKNFEKLQANQKELNDKLQTFADIPVFEKMVKAGQDASDVVLGLKGNIEKVTPRISNIGLSFGEQFEYGIYKLSEFSEKYAKFIDEIQVGLDLISQLQSIETDNRIKAIDSETQTKVDAIDIEIERRKAAGKDYEDLEKKKQDIQKDSDDKTKKLQKEQFERNKKFQKAEAIINGAQSILKTYATYGFTPVGVAAAIADAVIVALQLAVIEKQEFFKGGYTGDGGKYEEAGTVHKGEFVSKKETTKKHRNLLEALHTGNYSMLSSADLDPILRGTGVVLKEEVPVRINQAHDEIRRSGSGGDAYVRLSSMERKMDDFFKFYKNKPDERESKDGTRIIRKGNTTRRIKKG